MLCPGCGKEVADADVLCGFCGSSLSPGKHSSTESPPQVSGAALPGTPEQSTQRSGKATASLILALLSFAALVGVFASITSNLNQVFLRSLFFAGPLAGLLAVIYGHLAKASIHRSGGRLRGKGRAIVGLILGYLGLASMLFTIAMSVFAVLFVTNSRMAADQSSAVHSLQGINTAATIYAEGYGGFPPTLAVLGPTKTDSPNASAEPSKEAAGLIDEDLAAGRKSNYRFTYIPGPPNSAGIIRTYAVHADPAEPGVSGRMDYYTDQTCVIRVEKMREANQDSPPFP